MNKLNPRRIAAKPGLIGILGASVLLAVCFMFPEEVLGFRTPYFFSGIIIAGCFLWAVLRR
jgi:energy-converting hydrogenase Eha subunit B